MRAQRADPFQPLDGVLFARQPVQPAGENGREGGYQHNEKRARQESNHQGRDGRFSGVGPRQEAAFS